MKEFKFNMEAREKFVRGILCDMKSELDGEQDMFDVNFERMDFLNEGFGYRFMVVPRSEEHSARELEAFYVLHNYLQDMFNYLFNGKVDVSSSSDDTALELQFEIVSGF